MLQWQPHSQSQLRSEYLPKLMEIYRGCWWCGQPDADLQLDHVNDRAHSRDNRFENLILLCPNCHAAKTYTLKPIFDTAVYFADIRKLRFDWLDLRQAMEDACRTRQIEKLAHLLNSPRLQSFVVHCGLGYEILSNYLHAIAFSANHQPNSESELAIQTLACSRAAPLFDRQKRLVAAMRSLAKTLSNCEKLGFSDVALAARSHLAHCLNKRKHRGDLSRAMRILNGDEGPIASNSDNLLNRLQWYYQHFDHDSLAANTQLFAEAIRTLSTDSLSVACEIRGATILKHANMFFRDSPQRKISLVEEAIRCDEYALSLALRQKAPRDIFIRAVNLIRSLQELPSRAPDAAQAYLLASKFRWAAVGVDEQHMRVFYLEPGIVHQNVPPCVISVRSQRELADRFNYILHIGQSAKRTLSLG